MNEIENVVTYGALEVEPMITEERDIEAGGTIEMGIQKKFVDILYNQLEVDRYGCTVVATATAISNLTGKIIPYSLMKKVIDEGTGRWFTPGTGAYLDIASQYMVDAYNEYFGDTLERVGFRMSPSSVYEKLKISPIITGIYYSPTYFMDEQDNGKIDAPSSIGSSGHAITLVKINTMRDVLVKFAENYAGKNPYNVILADFGKNRKLFFNFGYYLTRR